MKHNKDFNIVIADDHPMLLKGLFEELNANGYNVIDQATNGVQALGSILNNNPEIAILDIDMPLMTGFEVIKTAIDKGVKTKFIVLSFHREVEYIKNAKALQISGYLLKEDSFFYIEHAIECALNGTTFFSRSFESKSLQNASQELKKIKLLTPSELTILKLIAKQQSNKEISDILSISIRTVEKHRSNIVNKLELNKETNILMTWALVNKMTIIGL